MSFKVRPTEAALEDAVSIGRWIASRGAPVGAERWIDRLAGSSDGRRTAPVQPGHEWSLTVGG